MKASIIVLSLIAFAVLAFSCTHKKESPKVLVIFYSQTSNTKGVAQEIAKRMGADIEEIIPIEAYDTAFQATIDRCLKDRELGKTPEIKPIKADIASYDLIFVGYPVWFGTFAPPMATFLDKADLSGKKVVPFCTFGSGGLESSAKDLAAKQPNAEILPGYGVRAARIDAVPNEVDQFLKASCFIEGEYVEPEPFPEQHPVGTEETEIFDKAVDGYPMLNAKAVTVASRTIPEGMEYMFTAIDKPREAKPNMPSESEITVYVTVENGKAPVFTKVVR